ncbi:MAG: DsbA family protein [Hyphomicrobiales bacterium]
MNLARLATFAAFGLALLAAPVMPRAADAFDADQKAAIGEIVRDYIVRNPEVIEEALRELDKRHAEAERKARAAAVAENRQTLLNSPNHVVLGNPDGDVTLVEFFDYNCGYCKRALADLVDLVNTDSKLRVVLKEFPVLGRESIEAAQVAIAVAQQGKYFEFHQAMLSDKAVRPNKARAMNVAEGLGVDMTKLKADMESDVVADTISEVYDLSNRLGINGTPAYVIGDEIIEGAVGFATLKDKIGAMRKCGDTSC